MPKRWLVKRRWFVVLETITYTRIYEQQQLGKCWCVVAGKIFIEKFFFAQNIFMFFVRVRKNFSNEKKRIMVYIQCSRARELTL